MKSWRVFEPKSFLWQAAAPRPASVRRVAQKAKASEGTSPDLKLCFFLVCMLAIDSFAFLVAGMWRSKQFEPYTYAWLERVAVMLSEV